MKRNLLIAGNWKMNGSKLSASKYMQEFLPLLGKENCDIALCVPYTLLEHLSTLVEGKVAVGAQNIAWADSGAFTGEISAEMLEEVGASFAIVGHSERRQMFGETDQTVNKRALQALKHSIVPIICVGETWEEREQGKTFEVLTRQTKAAFTGISSQDVLFCVVAYEPVWAIGTGKTATPEDANEGNACIRKVLTELYGDKAQLVSILYGGSMNAKNARELLKCEHIDGGLIGGASLKPQDFYEIVRACEEKA